MKQAIGYIRVSTEKQANEGVSLEAQEAKIVTWCKANGYELVKVYVDAGISGKRMDTRKELLAALASLKKGMALVSYSLSRLARSTKDALAIGEAVAKKKADMVSLTEQIDTTTAAGKMMFQMLSVLAEFERNLVAERTTNALQHKKRSGQKYTNQTPYGFEAIEGRLVEVKPGSRGRGRDSSGAVERQHPASHCRQPERARYPRPRPARPGHRPPSTCC